eukprot:TRINITY_DN4336_c0_g3_i2.p1 TRINITY_DN4336_c0_g3~~TRINITY_DN4336_c0_g3_i2.p1  ORF type:complete len:136 (+),score=17.63 TRINITY_DN4336_c0_g3_i2:71-478(+)
MSEAELWSRSTWWRLGCFSCASAVALGAIGSHYFRRVMNDQVRETWTTATTYHFIHSLALIVNSLTPTPVDSAGYLFSLGILLFSGSLYGLIVSQEKKLGVITPIGGLCFIGGWLLLGWFGSENTNRINTVTYYD